MNVHHLKLAQELTHSQPIFDSTDSSTSTCSVDTTTKASQACLSCRAQKKKCDKSLPSCALCARVGRSCNYSVDPLSVSRSKEFQSLQKKVRRLEAQLDGYSSHESPPSSDSWRSTSRTPSTSLNGLEDSEKLNHGVPAAFFLDATAFTLGKYQVRRYNLQLPQIFEVVCPTSTIIRNIVKNYYMMYDSWLPIISRESLLQGLNVPVEDTNVDAALLYLCMRLIAERLPEALQNPQTSFYLSVKEFFFLVESAGLLTIQLLQGGLLLAVYELGHAIFPAAYLTIGRCTKIGQAMNIHNTAGTPQMILSPATWSEVEERQRVWWATIVLDRYVAIGNPGLTLSAEDLSRVDCLPSSDAAWNEGNSNPNEPLYLSSPPSVPAGSFARMCQTSHLLGKILRHCSDQTLDDGTRFQEAIQLNRLLQALTVVISSDIAEEPTMALQTTMALCYSGMMVLNKPYSGIDSAISLPGVNVRKDFQNHALATSRLAAKETTKFAVSLQDHLSNPTDQVSPLTSQCLYEAASTLAWLNREMPGDPDVPEALDFLKDTLRKLDRRWRVAGMILVTYLVVISAENKLRGVSQNIGKHRIPKINLLLVSWK